MASDEEDEEEGKKGRLARVFLYTAPDGCMDPQLRLPGLLTRGRRWHDLAKIRCRFSPLWTFKIQKKGCSPPRSILSRFVLPIM